MPGRGHEPDPDRGHHREQERGTGPEHHSRGREFQRAPPASQARRPLRGEVGLGIETRQEGNEQVDASKGSGAGDQDRAGDLAWIEENVQVFWPAAHHGYETYGRGAVVVDTTSRIGGGGNPFVYFPQEMIEQTGDVTEEYLDELEERRNDAAKQARQKKRKPDAKVVSL